MDPIKAKTLRPSARHKLVAQLALAEDKAQKVTDIENLSPPDYGHYLIHSSDIKIIRPALNHPYPQTRRLAAKALSKAWLQLPPSETVEALGALDLADILNNATFVDAKYLSEKLGHDYRGPEDPRTRVLDKLVSLLIPSISNDGPNHPVCRLGSTLATMYLPAVSPPVVSQLLGFLGGRDAGRLRRLLYTQPSHVSQLLLADHSELENPNVHWKSKDLCRLFAMRSIRDIPSQPDEHWGINLFIKLITTPRPERSPFPSGISAIVPIGSSTLQNAPTIKIWTNIMEALIERAEVGFAGGESTDFNGWKSIILNITDKMSRTTGGNVTMEALKGYLKRIGRVVTGGDAGINALFTRLPLAIREDVLRSFHGLDADKDWNFPSDAPRVNLATIMQLNSARGKPIFRQILPHLNHGQFFANSYSTRLNRISGDLAAQPADRDDAISLAIQGRWAYLEGDLEEHKKTIEAVERWKKLVHRQRLPVQRIQYTRSLLIIVATIEDTNLLKETFAWVFDRFLKDVDVRPAIFQEEMSSCTTILAGKAENLEATARDGDEVVRLLIDAMSKARTEPSFSSYEFSRIYSLCLQILWARLKLCQKHSISESRTRSVINPIKELFLCTEKIQLDDPGTFGQPALYPDYYQVGWSSLSTDLYPSYQIKYRAVAIAFLDDVSQARDALYAEKRTALLDDQSEPSAKAEQHDVETGPSRYPWPCAVNPKDFTGLSLEKDAPLFYAYLFKIVFTPITKESSTEQNTYYGEWANAIGLYANSFNTIDERDAALLAVIQHYRNTPALDSGEQVDLSPHLLLVSEFVEQVQKSETLMETFFSPYEVGAFDDGRSNIFFGTLDPESKKYGEDINLSLFRCRRNPVSFITMMSELSCLRAQKGTHHLRRQLAIIGAVFWIHTLRSLETADKGYSFVAEEDTTLDFAALYSHTTLPEITNYRAYEVEKYIQTILSGIEQFTAEELQNLVKTVKSSISRIENQPHRDKTLRNLATRLLPKSHVPTMLEDDIFEVLLDKERSSLHRDFFNQALLATIFPVESNRLTRRLFAGIFEEMAKNSNIQTEGNEPSVKVSTIKYLVSLAARPCTGFSLEEAVQELEEIERQEKHPSIQEALISVLTTTIVNESRLRPQSQLEKVWNLLESLAITACSLNEKRRLTEKDWSKPTLPELAINNERPGPILNAQINTVPATDRVRWATMIEEMLKGQACDTKRWVNEFLKRHGAGKGYFDSLNDLEFGALLPCLSIRVGDSYGQLREYLPKKSRHLKILEAQVTSYLISNKLLLFSAELDRVDPEWKQAQDGKDFTSLVNIWSTRYMAGFQTLISMLRKHGDGDVKESLQMALHKILVPANMLISGQNSLQRTTPWETLISLVGTLRPEQIMAKKDQDNWKNNIRPLIEWLEEQVLAATDEDEQRQLFYFKLHGIVKSLLLPFPFLKPEDSTAYSDFAAALYELSLESLHQPPALLRLDTFLKQILPPLVGLAKDQVAVAECLIHQADDAAEEASHLGYRLAQQFVDYHGLTTSQREEMAKIITKMETHPDAMVRLIALERNKAFWEPQSVAPYDWASLNPSNTMYNAGYNAGRRGTPRRGLRGRGMARGRGQVFPPELPSV